MPQKTILVAPLNWGLGHATRCVPIIQQLLDEDHKVVLASDGLALQFLAKEFPQLSMHPLADLNVFYAGKKSQQNWNMLKQIPKLYRHIQEDKSAIEKLAKEIQIDGIVSDNRPGVFLKEVPSVYINHQLNVKSGWTTPLSSALHQQQMKNFDEVWVPDIETEPSLSGDLGHLSKPKKLPAIRYLGWVSRFSPKETELTYDYCVVISGPEPQRSLFETKVDELFQKLPGRKLCITGNPNFVETSSTYEKRTMLNSIELNRLLTQAKVVICRSGYTSLMDLLKLQKPALLVPTPGQFEQEYLAKRMQELGWFSTCNQDQFLHQAEKKLEDTRQNILPAFQNYKFDFSIFE